MALGLVGQGSFVRETELQEESLRFEQIEEVGATRLVGGGVRLERFDRLRDQAIAEEVDLPLRVAESVQGELELGRECLLAIVSGLLRRATGGGGTQAPPRPSPGPEVREY